ncbi:MAG TPA: NADH-quinone oxidoreductase subunit N, partial [Desulfobulbaceae bacterium]|nr:NADH-quinone oxidoreductase subunit N [Desulfobulbaceae bacterium]
MAILPELALLTGALAFFALSLSKHLDDNQVRNTAVFFGVVTFLCALISVHQESTSFAGCY